MCPLVKELKRRENIDVSVCVTAQHREMLDQVLTAFDIIPDFDLSIMKTSQTLSGLTGIILEKISSVIQLVKPDFVLVHGDTTTAFASALSAFYNQIPVGHVEAGLRTHNLYSPFPEEFNRQAISLISTLHFSPTDNAYKNLIMEGKNKETIIVTGNTAIDALKTTVKENYNNDDLNWSAGSRLVFVTVHRRESIGEPMRSIFKAIRRVVDENPEIKVIYPVHLNPVVKKLANEILGGHDRIRLTNPLDVFDCHNIMSRCSVILTDSGGIQEEAPALGKPVLVLRNTTERPEGVEAGTLKVVGTSEESVYESFNEILKNNDLYSKMSSAANPYGDGKASKKIADAIIDYFNNII